MLSKEEQYQHPFWRRKSNEILDRDDYTCRCCKSKTIQLNVHHLYYKKDFHIWDYENESLVTLCKDCHSTIHADLFKLSGIIAFEILSGKIDATDFLKRIKQTYNGENKNN